ncbi:hypothetical protein GKG47_09270 [Lactonifactor sp. BIOML-A3]|uniref:hypothetical protein n=1 Tax=unclassified Lactonifactor TaxID=2636670 RepID=UPI0012AF30D9|nr:MULTISPECIES: hypothetical protein [unclassified Lactonifactor]MSA02227.1 hypothetical protein [Lactonifactor sp. BIOML-A5]MSA08011.1 hypothetical protein [Lactonifactor sp. BIOML-A4]MSA12627.1 hypothetical protein [Lactonifactor sp. BIOML-A3]MSA16671.1 hypothetical protein [Lactonifactor sp. BIOML-A2]MSA37630.1 hypothetical protein [Lactonifactor sp. BIOML-A1]
MKYIAVRTYGNGKHMNKVHPMYFDYLSQVEAYVADLNTKDTEDSEKWIVMPITEYVGKVW